MRRRGELIAGVCGVGLFAVMFMNWYSAPGSGLFDQGKDVIESVGINLPDGADLHFNAWDSFSLVDVVLVLAAVVACAYALIGLTGGSKTLPVEPSKAAAAIGGLAFVLVLYRTIDPPGIGFQRELGLWLGLFATAGIALGGYLGMEDGAAEGPG